MGKLDLELGGRQKFKNTVNASMEQRKQESKLFDNNENEKNESTAVLFKLGYSYSVALCLLSSLKEVFSLNCKSKLVIYSVI